MRVLTLATGTRSAQAKAAIRSRVRISAWFWMLNSSTERVPAWRLQQTVNILRASREMPVIRFPGGTKRTSLGEEFVVDPAAALHLNTKSAFAWWYATRYMGVHRRLGGRLRANTPKKMASRSLFASGIVYPSCSTATVSAFGETVEKWFRHSSCFDKDGFPFASDPEGMQHGCMRVQALPSNSNHL